MRMSVPTRSAGSVPASMNFMIVFAFSPSARRLWHERDGHGLPPSLTSQKPSCHLC